MNFRTQQYLKSIHTLSEPPIEVTISGTSPIDMKIIDVDFDSKQTDILEISGDVTNIITDVNFGISTQTNALTVINDDEVKTGDAVDTNTIGPVLMASKAGLAAPLNISNSTSSLYVNILECSYGNLGTNWNQTAGQGISTGNGPSSYMGGVVPRICIANDNDEINTNLNEIGGVTISTNSGTADNGTQRVIIATDETYDIVGDKIYVGEYLKNSGTFNMATNWPINTIYQYQPSSGHTFYAARLLVTIIDNGSADPTELGGITALANGLSLYYKPTSGSSKKYLGGTQTVKITSNAALTMMCYDYLLQDKSGGTQDLLAWRYTFSKSGTFLKIEDGGMIGVETESGAENLSSITYMLMQVQGYEVAD